jgi:hypothetical protein
MGAAATPGRNPLFIFKGQNAAVAAVSHSIDAKRALWMDKKAEFNNSLLQFT